MVAERTVVGCSERPAIIMYVESAQPHTSIENARKCRQNATCARHTARGVRMAVKPTCGLVRSWQSSAAHQASRTASRSTKSTYENRRSERRFQPCLRTDQPVHTQTSPNAPPYSTSIVASTVSNSPSSLLALYWDCRTKARLTATGAIVAPGGARRLVRDARPVCRRERKLRGARS